MARVRSEYRPNERLSFSFSEQWNRFRLPLANGNFSVVFEALETDYAFSQFLSLSTILQMDTANAQAASANIRLRWNYRPDSDLYVISTRQVSNSPVWQPPILYSFTRTVS